VQHAIRGGVARHRGALHPLERPLQLTHQAGHEQVDLRGEVAVQGAECDVGALGDRAHLHRVEAALRGERERGIEDALAAFPLNG
jgi:hypothetical protein